MFRKTFAEINLDSWAHNLGLLQKSFSDAPLLCPMIKADGYGHGDVQLARVVEDMKLQSMGVCLLEEGLKLRAHGIKNQILVFRSFDEVGARALVDANLTPVVSDWTQIKALEMVVNKPLEIHLKFDTGMNRLGFNPAAALELAAYFKAHKFLRVKAILTHLFNGEDACQNDGKSAAQLNQMLNLQEFFAGQDIFMHALNSAGAAAKMKLKQHGDVGNPLMKYNWGLRPGIMTYGSNPLPGQINLDLKPVMNFRSEVCAVRVLKAGESVSYGGTFVAAQETLVAVVPVGYADGYHRVLSNKGQALICGERVPQVGNVCMDYMMFDATSLLKQNKIQNPDGLLGKMVTLFGVDENNNFLLADELAKHAQTISYEIMTSLSARVPRKYSGSIVEKWGK